MTCSMYLNSLFAVYPPFSMVSNCGFDDSGENAGKQNHLQSVPASDDMPSLTHLLTFP